MRFKLNAGAKKNMKPVSILEKAWGEGDVDKIVPRWPPKLLQKSGLDADEQGGNMKKAEAGERCCTPAIAPSDRRIFEYR